MHLFDKIDKILKIFWLSLVLHENLRSYLVFFTKYYKFRILLLEQYANQCQHRYF